MSQKLTITAAELSQALCSGWDGGYRDSNYQDDAPTACWSMGTYEGTKIPVRKVPGDAVLTLDLWHGQGGGFTGATITDSDGQWIADRFGTTLGARQVKRIFAFRAAA